MNKTLYLLLIFYCLVVSCSSRKDYQEKEYHIGVSQCSGGLWRDKLNAEMQRELLLHENVTMELRCANDNDEQQISDIQHFIDEKVDAILVSPGSEKPITPIISKAYDAGIPVILFDRMIDGNKYTAFVGGDNIGVGKALATFAINNLNNGGNVIELMGNMNSSPAKLRHYGFINTIKNYPNIHVIASIDCEWSPEKAKVKIDSLMKINKNIDIIVSHSDFMVSPTKDHLDKMVPGNTIKYIGADGFGSNEFGVVAVAQGKIDATAIYPTGGDIIMRTAIDVLDGKKVNHETLIPSHIISNPNDARFVLSLNDELTNETNNVIDLRSKVIFFSHQLKLERMLLAAMIAFLIVSICLIITFYRLYLTKRRTNDRLNKQQKILSEQRDQLIEVTKEQEAATNAKLVFFTNISHDFRTPLTLISAPVESVVSSLSMLPERNKTEIHLLHIAQRNIHVLLDLVGQILDFRKIENGKMELHTKPTDLLTSLRNWFESFQKLGETKDIKMEFQVDGDNWNLICDQKRIERMVYNLIGNSMKFTPSGGTIRMICSHHGNDDVFISVQDTGIGISQENLQRIFERFYQIDKSENEGTGIGLALVKNLVDMMHGRIDVHSNTDKSKGETGTTITMILPLQNVDENNITEPQDAKVTINPPLPVLQEKIEIQEDETRQVVLVIDDNDDIRTYLTILLGETYRVITAHDGANGLDIARQSIPDIILCDVMMPIMDGLECCRRLKSDMTTCHIPVLMLTACSLDEQQVKGLEEGAESYISKPFSSIVLLAQIQSLLKNRTIIRNFYSFTTSSDETESVANLVNGKEEKRKVVKVNKFSDFDEKFISKLRLSINDNLQDESFNVEVLADIMCLSRTQMYRKCKALTGDSPVELIRNSRLLKARTMLDSSDLQITEICKAVGIPDPSYFTKCYKAYFGVLPSVRMVKM